MVRKLNSFTGTLAVASLLAMLLSTRMVNAADA